MALIRATFFFKDAGGYGWTETVHNSGADLATVLTRANALARLRRNLLGSSSRLCFIRVSDDEVKRDSRVVNLPFADQTVRNAGIDTSDIANTCLVVRMETDSPVKRRTLSLRGFPDGTCSASGAYTPDAAFDQAFQRWSRDLLKDGWSIRSRDGTQPNHSIVSVTQVPATGVVTVTTLDAHLFELGKAILITGAKGCPQINGTWIPSSIPSGTTFTIQLSQIIAAYTGNGIAKKLGYTLAAITSAEVMRVSHRIAGRPFDSPVGRRRARSRP